MMYKNNSFIEIWEELKRCKNVAMTLHYGPDGDSIGSCTAMKYVLERDLDCKVTLVSNDELEDIFDGFSFTKEIIIGKDLSDLDLSSFDAVICLDAASPGMLSSKFKGTFTLPADCLVIQLDHHSSNPYYGKFNYVDSNCPSACSVLFEFFKAVNVKFDLELSRRLLLGICTDTNFFAFDNNPLMALEQANFLVRQGIDFYNEFSLPLRLSQSLKKKNLFATVINNIKINKQFRCAYSFLSAEEIKKLDLNESELRGSIWALQDLRGFDFVFTLTEVSDGIKGSLRSSANVDVSLFAKALGGGGHKAASAFRLPQMSLKDAEKKVLEVISDVGIHRY